MDVARPHPLLSAEDAMDIIGPKRWFFDAWSQVYDLRWVQRSTYRPIHDAVLAALEGRRGGRILDLGCGTGQLAARIAELPAGPRIIGCDFSAGMLRRAL